MLKLLNMTKFVKFLMILLSAMFLLTACGENSEAPIDENNAEQKHEEEDVKQSECWQAEILYVLYDALGIASMGMYKKITSAAIPLMMIAFSIWFAHRILIHVSSVTEENIGEVWKEVLQKFFVCFACGYIASTPELVIFLLNILIFPIYNAFLEFGSAVLAASNFESKGGYSGLLDSDIQFKQSLICTVGDNTVASLESGFPSAPKEMMGCMVCSINERLGIGRKLSFQILTGSDSKFLGWIIGIIVYCVFSFVKLGFVFYLVDTVFRMAVMTIILPVLIMSYAFKKTKEWTKKGFFIILNSAAFAAFIAILLTTALLAMEEIFINNPELFGKGEEAKKQLNQLSVTFICILLICFLLVSSITVAGEVASSLVGGKSNPKFQKKLKVVLEMIATWITGGAAKGVKKVAAASKAAKKS